MPKFIEETPASIASGNPSENPTRHEFLDPNPVAVPLRWNRPGSTLDEIRRATGLLSQQMRERGEETFEDADDFNVGDDEDGPSTVHELRSYAATMSPTELFEAVFHKPYVPPAPLGSGTSDSSKPAPSGDNPPIPVPSVTP